MQPEDIYKK